MIKGRYIKAQLEDAVAPDALVGLEDTDGNVIGGDSFASGTANTMVAPDGTVENSDLSYTDTVLSNGTLVLPDVNNIDSDGSTVPTPAGVPFTCTPCDIPQVWGDMFEGRVLFDGGVFEDKATFVTNATNEFDEYDTASLVITPNGYKDGTLHAFKPFDGGGDMDWSRNSDATRVNENGLIENVVATNLISYSEDYTGASWSKVRSSITSNVILSPDGLVNGSKLNGTVDNNSHVTGNINYIGLNDTVVYSVYVKKSDYDYFVLRIYDNPANTGGTGNAYQTNFNLVTGVVVSNETFIGTCINPFSGVIDCGNGWFRCYIGLTKNGSSTRLDVQNFLFNSSVLVANPTFTGSPTLGTYIWGAQLEHGAKPTTYIPTNGTPVTVGLNVPRIDYSSGEAVILAEPQRTNLFNYSEGFNNAYWSGSDINITADNANSPSDTFTADKLTCNSTLNSQKYIINLMPLVSNIYTVSFFVKANTYGFCAVVTTINGIIKSSYFNINTGVIGTTTAGTTSKIEDFGNGWYRVSQTATETATASRVVGLYFANSVMTSINTTLTLTDSLYIWGAQLEQGAYATSYIPTNSATVTRLADKGYGAGNATTFNSEAGVLFVEMAALYNDGLNKMISINDGTAANSVLIYYGNAQRIYARVYIAGVVTTLFFAVSDPVDFVKVAYRWSVNDYSLWINGVKVATNTTAGALSANTLTTLDLAQGSGGNNFYGKIKQISTFDYLTDLELQTLTTI